MYETFGIHLQDLRFNTNCGEAINEIPSFISSSLHSFFTLDLCCMIQNLIRGMHFGSACDTEFHLFISLGNEWKCFFVNHPYK